jgi:membrane protease YdiL (CAAX protease family)
MSTHGSDSGAPLPAGLASALTILGVLLMFGGGPALSARLGVGLRAQIALGTLLLALPAVLVLGRRAGAWRAMAGRALPGRALAIAALLGAALWVASLGLIELQSVAWPPSPEYIEMFRRIHRALAPNGPVDALLSVGVIAVLPGVCEELVVRGVLLPSLVGPLGPVGAVLGSALLFAAMHADPYRFLFTLSVGLVLGALRLRTGSLSPPVAAHVTLNALTFLVAPLVDDPSGAYVPEPVLGLVCLVTGAGAAWPLLRALRASPPAGSADS